VSSRPTSQASDPDQEELDEAYVKRLREIIELLRSLDDKTWSLIDQALDTSKMALGETATTSSLTRFIDDAVQPMPDGWNSAALAALVAETDEVRSTVGATSLDDIAERLDYLRSRHQVWLVYVVRRSGMYALDWSRIDSDYIRLNEEDLLRFTVERRDGSKFVLEMPPDSAVRLATRILRRVVLDLPAESLEIDDDDMSKFTEAVDNLRAARAKNMDKQQ